MTTDVIMFLNSKKRERVLIVASTTRAIKPNIDGNINYNKAHLYILCCTSN